jgi:hypothetical protein
MFQDAQTALGVVVLGLLCAAFSTLQPERLEAPTFDGVLDLVGWNCVLCDCPCTFPLPRILVWGTPAHARWSPA